VIIDNVERSKEYIVAENAYRDRKQVVCKGTWMIKYYREQFLNVASVFIPDEDE
jgi:hypothetical protein